VSDGLRVGNGRPAADAEPVQSDARLIGTTRELVTETPQWAIPRLPDAAYMAERDRAAGMCATGTSSRLMDLPRFRGGVSVWDQT
jgi:hypothetical protein